MHGFAALHLVHTPWLCAWCPSFGLCLQYGEFRAGYNKDKVDTRIVSYGLRYFIEQYVSKRWTLEDVERADAFYRCALPGMSRVCAHRYSRALDAGGCRVRACLLQVCLAWSVLSVCNL